MLSVIRIVCFVISAWWIIAVVADLLYVFFSHNPTDLTTYICNPFCIIIFPMLELKMANGIMVWLLGLVIVLLTTIFFL